ncbi:Phophatidylserine decarboxylase [Aspergillus parasiticus SU-1]|uniref:Phophatidylserine decarboxylase-domain-containing protein n=2 Tax=Aspergillus parasiticus TaxID=5067 RepID=A0A5N6DS45_ASPPA|nr:Phophatidylserine decarboxylase-domain-containing protein [Aspergillus parasiticus]KJK63430.1 Phophatidylserine decarboxylase [Aspergillus parasiticus SU-1]
MSTDIPYPFAPGEWLPPLSRVFHYVNTLRDECLKDSPYPKHEPHSLDPRRKYPKVITDFKDLVENDPGLKELSKKMFDEIPRFDTDQSKFYNVRSFDEALIIFDAILFQSPSVMTLNSGISGITVPFNAVLNWPANTPSGNEFFLNKEVNEKIKNIVNQWGAFLQSPASREYLNTDSNNGWFSPAYVAKMKQYAQWDGPIEDLYVCDPNRDYWGFGSWDAFFIRRFRPGLRPVREDDEPDIYIVSPCEAGPQVEEGKQYPKDVRKKVQARDTFWLKGQPYSIFDMLNYDGLSRRFVFGTVYQGWLSSACYHRWHAPISGTIKKVALVPGTYYSTVMSHNYPEPDPSGPNLSQLYLASVATRALIFIESNYKPLGLVCFIAIGMNEISSCEVTVKAGDSVTKGEEIGMFHMGGSAFCLLFENGVDLKFEDLPTGSTLFKLNSRLAEVLV